MPSAGFELAIAEIK